MKPLPDQSVLATFTKEQREVVSPIINAYADLREAVATHLRYLDSVIENCRQEHPDPEVAANIAQHQQRNLRRAAEKHGSLDAPRTFHIGKAAR